MAARENVGRRPARDAQRGSFTEIALVQIGADQQDKFFDWTQRELLPALQSP